ncbi:hypothetical protein C1645_829563 [Glomus cerebriforme]|uniref:Uncharacterized protein n=1 Tax=Glomus cerebriforme TaxID=658196 RepID=A0A397SJR0_9GLOM|nr:hypothetical protein C1645_829563 [Glomus cerebriforme]
MDTSSSNNTLIKKANNKKKKKSKQKTKLIVSTEVIQSHILIDMLVDVPEHTTITSEMLMTNENIIAHSILISQEILDIIFNEIISELIDMIINQLDSTHLSETLPISPMD